MNLFFYNILLYVNSFLLKAHIKAILQLFFFFQLSLRVITYQYFFFDFVAVVVIGRYNFAFVIFCGLFEETSYKKGFQLFSIEKFSFH